MQQQTGFSNVENALDAIADWVNKYRARMGARIDQAACGADAVEQAAKDLGLAPTDLSMLAAKGPQAADQLRDLLVALGIDPEVLRRTEPATLRDMQRLCTVCGRRRQCAHELAEGKAAEHYRDFCPNAFTLDALFEQAKQLPFEHQPS